MLRADQQIGPFDEDTPVTGRQLSPYLHDPHDARGVRLQRDLVGVVFRWWVDAVLPDARKNFVENPPLEFLGLWLTRLEDEFVKPRFVNRCQCLLSAKGVYSLYLSRHSRNQNCLAK